MLVDFSYQFIGREGEILKEPFGEKQRMLCEECLKNEGELRAVRAVTLKRVAISALDAIYENERNLEGEEKHKRGILADRIYLAKEPIDLTAEEISLIKKLIGKGFSPLIVSQSYKILEGKQNATPNI